MIKFPAKLRLSGGAALIAGLVLLAGCGPTPYSTTTTSEQVKTTMPAPMMSTTTTSTERTSQQR